MTKRLLLLACTAAVTACGRSRGGAAREDPRCDEGNGGITLPQGFCAAVFADEIGVARHLAVGPNRTLYVALEPPRSTSAGTSKRKEAGGIAVLRDADGDGRAELIQRIASAGGSGIALRGEWLYYSTPSTVERIRLTADGLGAAGPPDTVVRAIPSGGHSSRSLAFDTAGYLFVHVGSDSNVCTALRGGTGLDPCPELSNRAGIWRYAPDSLRQFHAHDGERWASGFRNAVALAWDSLSNHLFAASHGRDGLATLWPNLYTSAQSAESPSEEFALIERGDDFGWPYCFHDNALGKKVLAPEYGGDGHAVGRCATAKEPLIGFPGHWGPDGLLFLHGDSLPSRYRGAALIAFHGSWNRAPEPQAGYKVVLVPRVGSSFGPAYETFADGFAGGRVNPSGARYRPVGLAQDGSGAIYISDDQRGRIWRVVYGGARR